MVLPDVLYSIVSLLCTATNVTPHERLFTYSRRLSNGASIPSWLCEPGPVLLKSYVLNNKTDLYVDEVELLQANAYYAYIRYPDSRENTVSVRHLAPTSSCLQPEDPGNVSVIRDSLLHPQLPMI